MTKADIDAALLQVQGELGHLKICAETFQVYEMRMKELLPDINRVEFICTSGLDYIAKVYVRHPNVIFNGLVVV